MTCNKVCIANLDGECIAGECKGPIIAGSFTPASDSAAARFYELAAEALTLSDEKN